MHTLWSLVCRHWLRAVHEDEVPLAGHSHLQLLLTEMKPERLGGNGTTGSGCNNINMVHFTAEVTVVLISRPKYATTRDLGREIPIVVQFSYAVSCTWYYEDTTLLFEEWWEGVRAVGRLIETTGILETAARRGCLGGIVTGLLSSSRAESCGNA